MTKKLSYLIAGVWNTIFSYAFFYLLYSMLGNEVNYIILLVISQIMGLTNAFLVHKFLVFGSKGNWVTEYFRYYVVYSGSLAMNILSVILLVDFANISPVVSQFLVGGVLTVGTYIAHNKFSFRGSN